MAKLESLPRRARCLFSLITVVTCVAASVLAARAADVTTLRFATLQSPTNPMLVELQKALDQIVKRSDGRIKFQMHYGTEAGFSSEEFVRVLQTGLLDSALIATSTSAFDYPWLAVSGIPFLSPDLKTREALLNALRPLFDEFAVQHGIVPLAYPLHVDTFLVIYSKRKLEMLADMKGKLIRIYDPNSIAIVKGLGGVPVNMEKGEIYLALQKGTIDGAITGTTSAADLHFDEVTKFETNITPLFNPNIVGISRFAWEKLPKDQQDLMRDILARWDRDYMASINSVSAAKESFAYAVAHGMTIVQPGTDMQAAFPKIKQSVISDFLKKSGAQGKRALDLVNEALVKAKQ